MNVLVRYPPLHCSEKFSAHFYFDVDFARFGSTAQQEFTTEGHKPK